MYFRACPLTSILSPEGERKFGWTRDSVRQAQGEEVWMADAQSGEATTRSILVYFRARPLTSILSPEGERKFGRTRDSERQQQ